MSDKDFEYYQHDIRTPCGYMDAECTKCPSKVCFKESKRRAVAAMRHELMWALYQKGYKPRAIASVLVASSKTVQDVIRERKNN